ncbi:MAG: hypothetical protein AAFZ52_04590 [Bacteroidota bacterium]
MEQIERPLTKREIQLVELGIERQRLESQAPFSWGCAGGFGLLALLMALWLWYGGWHIFPFVVLLVALGYFFFAIYDYPRQKNQAAANVAKGQSLLKSRQITVTEYQCSEALMFRTEEDPLIVWALQVGPRATMIWFDWAEEYSDILPARRFEVIADPDLYSLFGKHILNPQERFLPTKIPAGIVGNAAIDNLPNEEGVILETTIDQLLEDAKNW